MPRIEYIVEEDGNGGVNLVPPNQPIQQVRYYDNNNIFGAEGVWGVQNYIVGVGNNVQVPVPQPWVEPTQEQLRESSSLKLFPGDCVITQVKWSSPWDGVVKCQAGDRLVFHKYYQDRDSDIYIIATKLNSDEMLYFKQSELMKSGIKRNLPGWF